LVPEDEELELNSSRKKGRGKIIFLLLMLFIIGFLMSVLVFNVFNIREKYLRNIINSIPVISNLLPEPKESDEEYTSLTSEELQYKIRQLQKQVDTQQEDIKNLSAANEELNLENKRLKEIESQQLEFKTAKEEFDTMIAKNDPQAYASFYEQISPENAEKLYPEVKQTVEQQKEIKKYISTFSEMEPDAAAGILEEMVQTDINLVVVILKNLDNEQRGNILAQMDAAKAAVAVKRLAPEAALNQ